MTIAHAHPGMHSHGSKASAYDALAANQNVVSMSTVASLAFLVWDVLITTSDEVRVIWPRPWTTTKILYFYIRYIPIITLLSTVIVGADYTAYFGFSAGDCYTWHVYKGIAILLTIWVADLILILRVFAIYTGCTVVRILLSTLFLGEIVCMSVGLGLALPGLEYDRLCYIVDPPSILFMAIAAPIVMQSLLFMLTAWKFMGAVRAGWGHIPLVVLLMRDGTWAFFMLFVILVGECTLYGFRSNGYSDILYGWILAAFSFSGYRILLNINQLTQLPQYQATVSIQTLFTTQIFMESRGIVDSRLSHNSLCIPSVPSHIPTSV